MIEESIKYAKEHKLFDKLNSIYNEIPSGDCKCCGKCCSESVHTYYIEFLNIYDKYYNTPKWEEIVNCVYDYYVNELVANNPCPMLLSNKLCNIVEVRPLVCRFYGHYTKQEHDENQQNNLESNLNAAEFYKDEYGVDLPNEIINRNIDHCKLFHVEHAVKKEEREDIWNNLLELDSKFFALGHIDEDDMYNGFCDWFIEDESLFEEKINNALRNKQ